MRLFRNISNKTQQPKKVFHFFETVSHSVFVVIVGLFTTFFLSFLGLSLLFFDPVYNQVVLFCLVGMIFFSWSYKIFLNKNSIYLRNLTYENFSISRKKLVFWVVYTFNFYLLFIWFLLIVIGSTNGFNIKFPTDDNKLAFVATDAKTTKILGFVLICVHMFLFVLLKAVIYYWDRILKFAFSEFEKRKKALQSVRSRAEAL